MAMIQNPSDQVAQDHGQNNQEPYSQIQQDQGSPNQGLSYDPGQFDQGPYDQGSFPH